MLEKSPCSHNNVVLISPDFDRAHPPDVVQVDGAVAGAVVVFGVRVRVSVPGDVQLFAGLRLHLFEAGDELAIGRAGVPGEAARQCSERLEDELFLLVPDSREVRDLRRREAIASEMRQMHAICVVYFCTVPNPNSSCL